MKEYLVTSDYGDWNNMWIVTAKNAQDAICQVWQQYILPMNQGIKELLLHSVGESKIFHHYLCRRFAAEWRLE